MIRAAALLLAAGLLSSCGSEDAPLAAKGTPTATPSRTPTPTPRLSPSPARTGTVVISAGSKYGTILYDASGQPIYLFQRERSTTPLCYGACAEAWPPVLTKGLPRAAKAVELSLLGTTRRKDGKTQVTYRGHPLYFYAREGKYQVTCHDVTEYGGTWLAVRPSGVPAPG